MFVLPYFHAIRKTADKTIHVLYLFLGAGGTAILQNQGSAQAFCEENDLPIAKLNEQNGIAFVKVDTTTLDHSAFYSFHEANTENVEVWKTFLWIGDDDLSDPWNTNEFFKKTHLNGFVLYQLLETILRLDA